MKWLSDSLRFTYVASIKSPKVRFENHCTILFHKVIINIKLMNVFEGLSQVPNAILYDK